MLEEIVKAADAEMSDVDAIAISRGPGSFTGLRIGSATAKGLGLALDKPLVEVPTLDAMAYNLYGITDSLICPIMDARRQEVYSGIYRFAGDPSASSSCELKLECVEPESAGPLTDVIAKLNGMERPVVFLGDGVPVYRDIIVDSMKNGFSFAPVHLSRQRAGSVV